MALKVGELYAVIRLEDGGFREELKAAQRALEGFKIGLESSRRAGAACVRLVGNDLAQAALGGLGKLRASGVSIGRNFAQALARGIASGMPFIQNAARSAALAAKKAAEAALQIHSPSKVSMKLGGYFSQGMADGILKNARSVSLASGRMAEMAASGLRYTPVRRAAAYSVPSDAALTIDYDRLAAAMAQRQTVLVSNGRVLARSTAADNSQALGAYKRRVAMGYGG